MVIKIKENNRDLPEDICFECGGNVITNRFEKVCKNCGLILEEIFGDSGYILEVKESKINLSKQYVALGDRANFVGGLGSSIDYENSKYLKDKSGKLLPPNEQRLFRRLKKHYAHFLRIKNHEMEYRIFTILNKISIYLNLNKNIQNQAGYYYKKILTKERKVINNISLIAFCIFYASRKELHNAPVTIKEIADAFQIFGHRVNPRLIIRDGIEYKKYLTKEAVPHKSEIYLNRLINDVFNSKELDERIDKKRINWSKKEYQDKMVIKCRQILNNLTSWQRGGRNPFILAGAIIYLADRMLAREYYQRAVLTQKIISDATKIPEYSIRDHYVNLLKPLFITK